MPRNETGSGWLHQQARVRCAKAIELGGVPRLHACESRLTLWLCSASSEERRLLLWWGPVADQQLENAFDTGSAEPVVQRAEEPDKASATGMQRAPERLFAIALLGFFALAELAWLVAFLLGLVWLLR